MHFECQYFHDKKREREREKEKYAQKWNSRAVVITRIIATSNEQLLFAVII